MYSVVADGKIKVADGEFKLPTRQVHYSVATSKLPYPILPCTMLHHTYTVTCAQGNVYSRGSIIRLPVCFYRTWRVHPAPPAGDDRLVAEGGIHDTLGRYAIEWRISSYLPHTTLHLHTCSCGVRRACNANFVLRVCTSRYHSTRAILLLLRDKHALGRKEEYGLRALYRRWSHWIRTQIRTACLAILYRGSLYTPTLETLRKKPIHQSER